MKRVYRYLPVLALMVFLMLSRPMSGATVEFTYAEGELFGYGQGMKENIDVAVLIDNPSLAGMKIKSFSAYLSGTSGIENTSMWLSRTLNLVDKKNVPDISSFTVTPVSVPYGDGTLGMLSVDLPEPYTLTGEPVYLGYSLTVTDNTTPEARYPIVVSEGANPDGFFLHMSKSVLRWMDYSKKAQGVAYIVVVLEGDINDYDLSISGYKEPDVIVDQDFTMELYVNNNGYRPVSKVRYTYTYDDAGEEMEGEETLPVPITPDVTVSVPLTLRFKGMETIGPHVVKLKIEEVDGNPNRSSSSFRECRVNVMPYAPTHRPLVEEFTGLWCGWCPRGWVGMEMLGEKFGNNVVIICYHNGDEMAVTDTYPVDFSGYPNAAIDRKSIVDPYYGSFNELYDFGISYDVENVMADMTIADISVNAKIEGTTVTATTATTFMKDIPDGNYTVGYVLTCNGLSNSRWTQTNYYTGLEEEYKGTYLEELTKMPKNIRGLVFNDVAVDVSGMRGIAGSLPQAIKTAEIYEHTFTFDIADNRLVADPAHLVVNAVVIDGNSGKTVNAAKYALAQDAGNGILMGEPTTVATEYYNLNGNPIQMPCKGVAIKIERKSDGTVSASKIIH